MKLLALDSATEACSAALWLDGEIRERFQIQPRQHTHLLLPMAHSLMMEAGLGLHDLDTLAFGQGPGSFTGIRIATGIVQGLALGLDLPVIGISTMAAMAARAMRLSGVTQVAVAVDARMNQIYWGSYVRDESGNCCATAPDILCEPSLVPPLASGQWHAAGTGWARHEQALRAATGITAPLASMELYPRAEEIARLAVLAAGQGSGVSAAAVQPIYLRNQVAEKMK